MNRNTKHVSTPCGDIAYTEQGTGPAALFVHGVFLNGYCWRHVIDRVVDMRRCIAVDLLAHGGTGASAVQDLSFSAQADMLDAFCTALALEPVELVANDSGGGIAQIFAARHPECIRSLTLTKQLFCHDSNACYKEISMNIELNQNGLCLKTNQLVKVRGGLGHSIVCDSGTVWVTQDGDPRDVILRAGESFMLDREGPALLQAFEPGAISIRRPAVQTRATRLAAFLKSALSGRD